jgi:hypothetical protein
MQAHVRVKVVSGLHLKEFPKVTGVFVKVSLTPGSDSFRTKPINREDIRSRADFSNDTLTFAVKEKDIPKLVLQFVLYMKLKPDPISFAFLSLPLGVCSPGSRVEGKFAFTCESFYTEGVKGCIEVHIATDPRKRPFSDEKRPIDMSIIQQFIQDQGAGKVSVAGTRDSRLPSQEMVDAVEAALATAPPEMWNYFLDMQFLKDGLRYFRAPGAPPA